MRLIDLSLGQLAEPLPQAARLALAGSGGAEYAPVAGSACLRSAVAAHYVRRGLETATASGITVSAGGRHGLLAAIAAVAAGGEVLVPRPHWSHYPKVVAFAGAHPVPVDGDPADGWLTRPALLNARCTARTRALIVNSPVNPTGSVYDAHALAEISGWAARREIHLIVDDSYWAFSNDGHLPPAGELATVVGSATKTHAMAGLRVGWVWSHDTLLARIRDFVEHTTGPASAPGQAAVAAVLDDDAAVATRADRLRALRDYSIQLFGAVPLLRAVPPAGGIYLCLDASAALRDGAYGSADDHELCARLAEVAGVRLRAGSTFGLDGHLRLCVAAPREVLRAAAERLTRFFSAARRPVAASAGPVLAGGAPCQ